MLKNEELIMIYMHFAFVTGQKMSFTDKNNRFTLLPEEGIETFNFLYNKQILPFKGNFNSDYTKFYTTITFQGKEKDAVIQKNQSGKWILYRFDENGKKTDLGTGHSYRMAAHQSTPDVVMNVPKVPEKVPEKASVKVPEKVPEKASVKVPKKVPEKASVKVPKKPSVKEVSQEDVFEKIEEFKEIGVLSTDLYGQKKIFIHKNSKDFYVEGRNGKKQIQSVSMINQNLVLVIGDISVSGTYNFKTPYGIFEDFNMRRQYKVYQDNTGYFVDFVDGMLPVYTNATFSNKTKQSTVMTASGRTFVGQGRKENFSPLVPIQQGFTLDLPVIDDKLIKTAERMQQEEPKKVSSKKSSGNPFEFISLTNLMQSGYVEKISLRTSGSTFDDGTTLRSSTSSVNSLMSSNGIRVKKDEQISQDYADPISQKENVSSQIGSGNVSYQLLKKDDGVKQGYDLCERIGEFRSSGRRFDIFKSGMSYLTEINGSNHKISLEKTSQIGISRLKFGKTILEETFHSKISLRKKGVFYTDKMHFDVYEGDYVDVSNTPIPNLQKATVAGAIGDTMEITHLIEWEGNLFYGSFLEYELPKLPDLKKILAEITGRTPLGLTKQGIQRCAPKIRNYMSIQTMGIGAPPIFVA